jgi:hypothetical protein
MVKIGLIYFCRIQARASRCGLQLKISSSSKINGQQFSLPKHVILQCSQTPLIYTIGKILIPLYHNFDAGDEVFDHH